jgi:hypothetical protein
VTTRSVVAYGMYERGLRNAHYRGDVAAARSLFEAAVAEDSLFPLAQYYSASWPSIRRRRAVASSARDDSRDMRPIASA